VNWPTPFTVTSTAWWRRLIRRDNQHSTVESSWRREGFAIMAERTIFITGATDGLGRALALNLAAEDVRLVVHGRDRERLERLRSELTQPGRLPPVVVRADLASMAQVHQLAEEVSGRVGSIDVLVNNAGIGPVGPDGPERRTSVDGYELRFAVNYLAGFDLTLRVLPLLAGRNDARIVNVASIGQNPIDFDDVMIERDYTPARAYGQSKLAQITWGFMLAERLRRYGIAVNSLHPATNMPTKMVLTSMPKGVDTLESGEEATRRLVNDATLAGVTGRYYDHLAEAQAHASAYDPGVQQRLWQLSMDLTGAPDSIGSLA
jgi:NAD(P)-dependent dehydrogenase (short-subunit alcohol dehydrogenase family)